MISTTMIAVGSLTRSHAVHTPGQLYLAPLRVRRGGGRIFPGVIVYLSHGLPCGSPKATSNFMAAIPLSFVIGSPIAAGSRTQPGR